MKVESHSSSKTTLDWVRLLNCNWICYVIFIVGHFPFISIWGRLTTSAGLWQSSISLISGGEAASEGR